jgi:protein-S-isoprenylcysteine O-methyltransferase Ste14
LPFSGPPIFAWIFWSAYSLWLVLEMAWGRTKRSGDPTRAKDRGSFRVIVVLLWIALALDFSLSFLLPEATIFWHRRFVYFAGVGLMLAGMAFRYYAIRTLGRFFTFDVATHAGQTVIESGPYRYIRHPSYTGGLITLLGVGLALGNWAGLAVLLAIMSVAYAYRIHVEEAALVQALGEPYAAYRRRSARLIPFLF